MKPIKTIRYAIEAMFCYLLYYFFYMLPIDVASNIAGFISEKIGVRLKPSKVAYANLSKCFPDMSEEDKQKLIVKMWNNLGRIIGELPHWSTMPLKDFSKRVKINKSDLKKDGTIFVLPHLGNFELCTRVSQILNMKLNLIYRPANNPWVNHLINSNRVACGVKLIPKGVGGVRRVYQALKSKESVAMLTDQKTNDGDVVDFFGFPTKCTTLPAKLALKLNARIIAVKAIRTHGANYVVEFDSPLKFDKSDDPIIITNKINLVFEKWIRKNPEQWFWLHKLWG